MGTSVNAQSDSDSDYVYRVKEMCRIVIERSTSIFKSNDFLYAFSKDSKKEHDALKVLHDYTKSVIRKRKEQIKKQNSEAADEIDDGGRKRLTFLDLLLKINVEDSTLITEEEIREEVDTFLFAVSFNRFGSFYLLYDSALVSRVMILQVQLLASHSFV